MVQLATSRGSNRHVSPWYRTADAKCKGQEQNPEISTTYKTMHYPSGWVISKASRKMAGEGGLGVGCFGRRVGDDLRHQAVRQRLYGVVNYE